MDVWEETERSLVELNQELSRRGDPARIRYFVIQPDPDWDADWVKAVWELPPPGRGRKWQLDQLMDYERMLEDRLGKTITTSSLFRTAKNVAKAYRNARPVPEAAGNTCAAIAHVRLG